jgi:PAS domain-containing protein
VIGWLRRQAAAFRLGPVADEHDAEYWARQIQVGGWVAVGFTLFGCLRILTDWDVSLRWWAWPCAAAALLQLALTRMPWTRLVYRPGVREVLILWWILEVPVLFAFTLVDTRGDALYVPGALLLMKTAAALYPPRWMIPLGTLSVAGFVAMQFGPNPPGVAFTVGMSVLLASVVGFSARTAANRWRQDFRRRAAERRTEILLRNASDAILGVDVGGAVRYVGPSVHGLLGYEPERLAELVHPDHARMATDWLRALAASPDEAAARCEMMLRRADGSYLYVEAIGAAQTADPAGVHRPAHRAGQPVPLRRAAVPHAGPGARGRDRRGGVAHRPERLQGDQRHLGPRGRRRGAGHHREAARPPDRVRDDHDAGAPRRRRVRGADRGHRRAAGGHARRGPRRRGGRADRRER